MREPSSETEFSAMNSNNSALNQQLILPFSDFYPTSSHDDFLEQMLSSLPSSAASFPWADDQPSLVGNLEEQSSEMKMRQQHVTDGAAKALMIQRQLLLSKGIAAANEPPLHAEQSDVVDKPLSNSANLGNDASIKALFNVFTGSSLGQTFNQTQHFHNTQGGLVQQSQNHEALATSGPATGGAAGQQKQRVRARRGQATDPHSIAERLRRERIAERMKALQELVPNTNKTDKASMLDEIIDYVKFLQLQVKVLSMSRLGGAAAVAPLVADKSSERGRSVGATLTASSLNDGMSVAEQQVTKLMEEDMGAAMQYLQGKGLCLLPISLATSSQCRNPLPPSNSPLLNGKAGGPLSPSLSVLTVQAATIGGNGCGEDLLKDSSAASKLE